MFNNVKASSHLESWWEVLVVYIGSYIHLNLIVTVVQKKKDIKYYFFWILQHNHNWNFANLAQGYMVKSTNSNLHWAHCQRKCFQIQAQLSDAEMNKWHPKRAKEVISPSRESMVEKLCPIFGERLRLIVLPFILLWPDCVFHYLDSDFKSLIFVCFVVLIYLQSKMKNTLKQCSCKEF